MSEPVKRRWTRREKTIAWGAGGVVGLGVLGVTAVLVIALIMWLTGAPSTGDTATPAPSPTSTQSVPTETDEPVDVDDDGDDAPPVGEFVIDEQGLLVPPVTNDPAVLAEAAMLSIFTYDMRSYATLAQLQAAMAVWSKPSAEHGGREAWTPEGVVFPRDPSRGWPIQVQGPEEFAAVEMVATMEELGGPGSHTFETLLESQAVAVGVEVTELIGPVEYEGYRQPSIPADYSLYEVKGRVSYETRYEVLEGASASPSTGIVKIIVICEPNNGLCAVYDAESATVL